MGIGVVALVCAITLTVVAWQWVTERPVRSWLGRIGAAVFTCICLAAVLWYALLLLVAAH